LERGECILLKRLKTKKKKKRRSRMRKGSNNITMKLKYIIIIPIYSLTDKLYCLINTATALLTDCSIRVSRSVMTKDGGHVLPLDPPLPHILPIIWFWL